MYLIWNRFNECLKLIINNRLKPNILPGLNNTQGVYHSTIQKIRLGKI